MEGSRFSRMASGTTAILVFPGFIPCKEAVGSLSNSKVWQHGNAYAIISRKRRGGVGEAEHRIARLLLFNSVIVRLHVSWEHLHKTRAQRAALVDYRRLKNKQTNRLKTAIFPINAGMFM